MEKRSIFIDSKQATHETFFCDGLFCIPNRTPWDNGNSKIATNTIIVVPLNCPTPSNHIHLCYFCITTVAVSFFKSRHDLHTNKWPGIITICIVSTVNPEPSLLLSCHFRLRGGKLCNPKCAQSNVWIAHALLPLKGVRHCVSDLLIWGARRGIHGSLVTHSIVKILQDTWACLRLSPFCVRTWGGNYSVSVRF